MTPCVFSDLAEADLDEIGTFIAADNPHRAITFIKEVREHCLRIAQYPGAFRLRKELGPDLRVAIHGRDLIVFACRSDMVVIERIVHGARDTRNLGD